MQEDMRDFAIKLFGKTISFPHDHKVVAYDRITVPEQRQSSSETSTSQDSKDVSQGSFRGTKHDDDPVDPTDETLLEAATSSEISDGPNTPSLDTGPQEKTLKKPDKIIPCPRCNSMETKFCYYNNYNVSQPRHFCKKCQRYWTAGGTMRNVPVGSGRRKSKNASIVGNYDHINGIHLPSLKPNGNEFYEHSSGPNMGPPGFPVTFYPTTPYWACAMPGSWNGPWALAQSPGPNSSSLGKHSREGNMLIMSPSNLGQETRPVLTPKTLRIHDPSDAAKSSIWSTLGMKNGKVGSTDGMSLFKAFESKGNRNVSNIDTTQMVLQANPAALSRSLNFNESL